MKLSIGLPQTGALASAHAVSAASRLAEDEGVHGVWVMDRLLMPVAPRDPYPVTPDGSLSPQFACVLDPLQVLAAVAAATERVRIGTGVLVMPWYQPVTLARSLATLDVLSGGRLDVGLGVGWSRDECVAAGAPETSDSSRLDEFVDVLLRTWTDEIVVGDGPHYPVPASRIGLTPVQRPHPPLAFAAYTPAAMRRVARVGDAWLPAGLPVEAMEHMWSAINAMAAGFGRELGSVRLVVRANVSTVEHVVGERPLFAGDAAQIASDIARCHDIGADEVIVDVQFSEAASGVERFVDTVATIVDRSRQVVGVPA